MAAKEKPAPVQNAGLGALTNLFNKTNSIQHGRFQYSTAAVATCWFGILAMRSGTPTVENETLGKLFGRWAMWVQSPHSLFTDDRDKKK